MRTTGYIYRIMIEFSITSDCDRFLSERIVDANWLWLFSASHCVSRPECSMILWLWIVQLFSIPGKFAVPFSVSCHLMSPVYISLFRGNAEASNLTSRRAAPLQLLASHWKATFCWAKSARAKLEQSYARPRTAYLQLSHRKPSVHTVGRWMWRMNNRAGYLLTDPLSNACEKDLCVWNLWETNAEGPLKIVWQNMAEP